MTTRPTRRSHGGLLVLAALLAATSLFRGETVQADEGPKQPIRGVWVCDIRIVRVDPPTAAGMEAPSPFPELTGTTIGLTWPVILGRLKKRGVTTILLDQRVTAITGDKCSVKEESTTPVVGLISEDINNKQYRSMPIRAGTRYEQTVGGGQFRYQASVNGVSTPPAPKKPPPAYTVSWQGSHPVLQGKTLVLVHRRQIAQTPPMAAKAVEHYALITGRFVPTK